MKYWKAWGMLWREHAQTAGCYSWSVLWVMTWIILVCLITLTCISSFILCIHLSSAATGMHCVGLCTNRLIFILANIHLLTTISVHFCCGRRFTCILVAFCKMFRCSHCRCSTTENTERCWPQSAIALRGIDFSLWHIGALASVSDI